MTTDPKPPLAARAPPPLPPRFALPWLWIVLTCSLTTCLVGPCAGGAGWWLGRGKGVVEAGQAVVGKEVGAKVAVGEGAEFDPKDLKMTKRWIDETWKPFEHVRNVGNDIIVAEAKTKANKEFAKIRGRTVDWVVSLEAINFTPNGPESWLTVSGIEGTAFGAFHPSANRNSKEFVIPSMNEYLETAHVAFMAPKDGWVRTAKRGDSLRLRGTIAAIYHGFDSPELPRGAMVFLFADAKFSPMKK